MRSTVTSRVVERVLSGAASGEFLVAELLPSERDLARVMGISRTSVAAAYSELERRGHIRRVHGKGAFLCAISAGSHRFSWNGKISRFANSLDEPVLELLARGCSGEFHYPLSAGTPSLKAFPKADYRKSVSHVLETSIPSALAVGSAEGQSELRGALATWLDVPRQQVMITVGAQEGIDLTARCLLEPGDPVVVDSPCYPGAMQSFLSAGARLLPWGTDWSLPQLEKLLLRYRPKLIFTTPTFQNPTGRIMSLKTRHGLLDLAYRYGVPVLEDGVYSASSFGDHREPTSLYRLDQNSIVINCSTFSKIFAPGLRIGWLCAPLYMIKQLSLIKMRSNLFTGGLNQLVMADMITRGLLDDHLKRLKGHHRALRDVAVAALQPLSEAKLLRFRIPEGGLYLWCRVLFPVEPEVLFDELEQQGVSVAPGTAFEPDRQKGTSAFFRLCFTAVDADALGAAIKILNNVLMRLSTSEHPAREESLQHEF